MVPRQQEAIMTDHDWLLAVVVVAAVIMTLLVLALKKMERDEDRFNGHR